MVLVLAEFVGLLERGEKNERRIVSRPGCWAEGRVDLKQAGVELGWVGLASASFSCSCVART